MESTRLQRLYAHPKRWLSALDDRFAFRDRGHITAAILAACVICAVVALLRGQDANWDLQNYHLYNAYAWLEGRVGVDLAPAQMQTYFNPLLDVPYYLLSMHAPAMLTGVLLGLLHGLCFAFAAAIAWVVLASHPERARLAPLFGLAGCLSAAFLSELGNTMSDNTTAPLMLAGVWLVLAAQQQSAETVTRKLLLAGVALGMAVAFKLTNGVYAVALGVAMLAAPMPRARRIRDATLVTSAAMLTFALLAGPWLWTLWSLYGNPLFPQLNAWFEAPLAQSTLIADARWRPQGVMDAVLRPLVFTFHPTRASEIPLRQIIWAPLYLLALATPIVWWLRQRSQRATASVSSPSNHGVERTLLVFFFAGFALWLMLFAIHRYLVVLELLAPLVLWLLIRYLFPFAWSGRLAAGAVIACSLVALWGWEDWGNTTWTRDAFRVQVPAMQAPESATVILVGSDPQSWRIPLLPSEAVYVSVRSNFPESQAYSDRISQIVTERDGAIYAMLPAGTSQSRTRAERYTLWANRLWLTRGECGALRWLVRRSKRFDFVPADPADERRCRLAEGVKYRMDVSEANDDLRRQARDRLQRYGFSIQPESCQIYDAYIGGGYRPYQWCSVERQAPLSP